MPSSATETAAGTSPATPSARDATAAETLRGLTHSLKGATEALLYVGCVVRQALADDRPADIEVACEVLDRQVRKVMNLAKAVGACDVDTGNGPLLRRLDDVVADLLAAFEAEARARGLSLVSRVHEACGCRTCDAVVVHRCLVNLLTRAFRSCPPGGSVAVEFRGDDQGGVVVEVSSTSSELEDEAPADGGLAAWDVSPGQDGDLSAITALVHAHNGRLETHSQPGVGTLCRLSLPLQAAGI